MSRSSNEIFVVAAVIWRQERYLAVCRPEGMPWAGWWEFPGGKIEPGESREAALSRELREELGITPEQMVFWREKRHSYPDKDVHLYFYHVFEYQGTLRPLEGQELCWIDPGAPGDLAFLPADVELVDTLRRQGAPSQGSIEPSR